MEVRIFSQDEKKEFFENNIKELEKAIDILEDSIDKGEDINNLFNQIRHNIRSVKKYSNY